jgi:hypothetical protein
MKAHLTFAVAALILGACVPAFAQTTKSPLVGVWRMTSLQVGNDPGNLQAIPYSGQTVFSDAGTMSVQAMNPDANAAPTPYAVNGYEAFYGTVAIDDAKKTFVVTVKSSLVRNLIGQKMDRVFEVSGNQLVLMPANPAEGYDLCDGFATQVALASSDDSLFSFFTGQYLHHMAVREPSRVAQDVMFQDRPVDLYGELTGITLEVH